MLFWDAEAAALEAQVASRVPVPLEHCLPCGCEGTREPSCPGRDSGFSGSHMGSSMQSQEDNGC